MDRRNTSRMPQQTSSPPPQRPWYFTDKGLAAILGGAICLGLFLAVIVSIQALAGGGSSGDSHNQPNGAQPTAMPISTTRPTPIPTPTPKGPHVLAGAFIGGTQPAFTSAYGQPTMVYGTPYFATTASDGTSAQIDLSSFTTGKDGQQRTEIVGVDAASGGSLTIAEARSIVKRLMPPDATYVKDVTDPNVGVIHVYQSADLALTLPQAAFADSNGGTPWPLGTFSVHCDDPSQPCVIATGV